jgi:hypothetical protein
MTKRPDPKTIGKKLADVLLDQYCTVDDARDVFATVSWIIKVLCHACTYVRSGRARLVAVEAERRGMKPSGLAGFFGTSAGTLNLIVRHKDA